MRLDKFLSTMGIDSRSKLKQRIKAGEVLVNGQLAKDGKLQVDPTKDDVQVNQVSVAYQPFVYYMLNKPAGVITANKDSTQSTVIDLLKKADRRSDLYPVGRLDKDTTGLLLLTNNGPLGHQLLSPKHHVKKSYEALIDGIVTEADCQRFAQGVRINDKFTAKPAKLEIKRLLPEGKTVIQVTITEGKYHQVKRMLLSIDKPVLTLKRLTMGSLTLDSSLKVGAYRELTQTEVTMLFKH